MLNIQLNTVIFASLVHVWAWTDTTFSPYYYRGASGLGWVSLG